MDGERFRRGAGLENGVRAAVRLGGGGGEGVPKPLAAEDAETTKKRACARVAAEVAAFWSEAWDRATKKPIPTAAELVPPPAGEAEGAGAGAATTNGGAVVAAADLSKTDSGRATRGAAAAETTQAKTTPPKAEKQEAAPADVVMAEADGDAKANGGDAKGAFARRIPPRRRRRLGGAFRI